MNPLRILLVDDHVLFRKGIVSLLAMQADFSVVGEASDGGEAVERARDTRPDIVLMDIHMPGQDGLAALRTIKSEMPDIHVIMLTVSDSDRDLFAAIKSGADGYLTKNLHPDRLLEMLEGIRKGESPLSGALASRLLNEFREPTKKHSQSAAEETELTVREKQVLELLAEGYTNKQIAAALAIAEDTARAHLRNILEKLHLQNRIQAAVYAVRQGLASESAGKTSPPG